MKRRKVLQSLGFGLSAGWVMPSLLSSCKKDDPGPEVDYDGVVGIIGAGAAGLYAADILRSKGVKVLILEASSNIGGRVRSLRNQNNISSESIADFPVELGADITVGSDSILGKIFTNLNVPIVDLATAVDNFVIDQIARSGADWGSDPDYLAVQNFISSTLPGYSGPAASMNDASGVSARGESLLNSQAGNFYGSASSTVGAVGVGQNLAAVVHDNKLLVLKANSLQDILLSRFSQVTEGVLLNTQVKTIAYDGELVLLTDANGVQHSVNKVIVTAPLAVLKSGDITFSPGLPSSHVTSMSRLGMDASIRVVIDFKKNFWGENTGMIWGGINAPQIFNAGAGRSEFYRTFSITINGPKAVELSAMGADMINPILEELDTIYGVPEPGIPNPATHFARRDPDTDQVLSIIQDWTKDEFVKGGFSYPLIGATEDDRKAIATPINEKLFFAGEATDISGDSGTVNGALASAERAVEEVVKAITGAT